MEFACSHVVCNGRTDGGESTGVTVRQQEDAAPPPLPPRRLIKPQHTSLPPLQPPIIPSLTPPPVPPRVDKKEGRSRPAANINVVSLSIGKLVDISQGLESFDSPVTCGKCSAALSCLSLMQRNVWVCEFCECENNVDNNVDRVCIGQRSGVHSDDLYLPNQSDDDYQNLEDTLVVFCVDISGSMSVTTEVASDSGFVAYISRLESIQDALQRALSSLLQLSSHRRVALVTFNNEVVIYGDGTCTPLTLKDWALMDYDHIWEQGVAYRVPHCIAETHDSLLQRVRDFSDSGATSLGPAVLASVAIASRYPGSRVILCTDGKANIGLGKMEETPSLSSSITTYFYQQLAQQALQCGVIISVLTFEGTDCCLANVGRLADMTGGRVNMVSTGTVATEIQVASLDNVLATGVSAMLVAPEGVYFPYEAGNNHKFMKEIGNVTEEMELTVQFAVKPEFVKVFLRRQTIPFQLQLSFKTRDQKKVTRIITEQRPVTTSSLTIEGQVQEAQRQLKAQQVLLQQISEQREIQTQENIYSNWMDTMTTICDDISTESLILSDEAAKVMYQMKRVNSVISKHNTPEIQKKANRKKKEECMP